MRNYLIAKPYEFVPRFRPQWPVRLLLRTGLLERTLRKRERVTSYNLEDAEKLEASLRCGHAVLLVANHSRTADPLVLQFLARDLGQPFYFMASSHVFQQGFFQRHILRWVGGFSVNRESHDRRAISEAISILETAERPLVMFPEGTTSRTNERVAEFMPGSLFIGRLAASRRQKNFDGKVVCHPLAITYAYCGDYASDIAPLLTSLEKRLGWPDDAMREPTARVKRLCVAALRMQETVLELEPAAASVPLDQAFRRVIERRLSPIEEAWKTSAEEKCLATSLRVRSLIAKIFPEMTREMLSDSDRARRWRQLESLHVVQQLARFEHRRFEERSPLEQLAETSENLHELLTGEVAHLGPWTATIQVGSAIPIPAQRQRHLRSDPCLQSIQISIQEMIDRSLGGDYSNDISQQPRFEAVSKPLHG